MVFLFDIPGRKGDDKLRKLVRVAWAFGLRLARFGLDVGMEIDSLFRAIKLEAREVAHRRVQLDIKYKLMPQTCRDKGEVPMAQPDFYHDLLAPELADNLRELNPHWAGLPGPQIPRFRRHIFPKIYRSLHAGLTQATVLRGTRRVGKTIIVRQVIEKMLDEGIAARRILYVALDEIRSLRKLRDPILTIARWYESRVLQRTLNEAAHAEGTVFLLLDEVQNLDAWAPQLKHLVDNNTVRVLLTGSSSLRIETGRDSLAGRITTFDLGPLLLREIAELSHAGQVRPHWEDNGADRLSDPLFWTEGVAKARVERALRVQAFNAFSVRGGYPIAHERGDTPWPEIAAYLNANIVKRAIQHDLRLGPRGTERDKKLLEEVFRLCCRYAGQGRGSKRVRA